MYGVTRAQRGNPLKVISWPQQNEVPQNMLILYGLPVIQQFKFKLKMASVFNISKLLDCIVSWTYRGRDKMAPIFQTTYSNSFSWRNIYDFRLRFPCSLLLRFQLTIFHYWLRKWLVADQATRHYLNQFCLKYCRIYASLGLNQLIRLKKLLF